MIRAFENGKTTQEIAAFFGLPLEEVVNTIYSQQQEWTLDTVARFANTSEPQVAEALQEACSILDSGSERQLKNYAEGYRRKQFNEWVRGYVVGREMGLLLENYKIRKNLEQMDIPISLMGNSSVSMEVAQRRLDLLLFMYENNCSFEQIHIALGINEENAKELIEGVQEKEDELGKEKTGKE